MADQSARDVSYKIAATQMALMLERSEIAEAGEVGRYLDRLEAIANELSQYVPHGDNPEPSHEYPGWFEVMAAEKALERAANEARRSLEGHSGK